ncbi:MAG: peptide chain release factor family protein [Kiritimatiellia bacterium]
MAELHVRLEKRDQLAREMEAAGVREDDLKESFILGAGPGGQKVNKSSVCVMLIHQPSGKVVKCSQTRSRALNRYYARKILCERILAERDGVRSKRQQEMERIRRQKRRRSRRQQARILDSKRQHGALKASRRKVSPGEE